MIKAAIDYNIELCAKLIYINSTGDFPFRRELERWQQRDRSLCIHYVVSGKEGRVTEAKLKGYLEGTFIREAKYYVAGPPGMVSSFESILSSLQIEKDNILTDSFTGY